MNKQLSFFFGASCILFMMSGIGNATDEDLNLDENNVLYSASFLGDGYLEVRRAYNGQGLGTGYGRGGYGDPPYANFNLTVCPADVVNPQGCTAGDPDGGMYIWRFIENIGWRKFAPYGAARKDWWEFKNTSARVFFNSF